MEYFAAITSLLLFCFFFSNYIHAFKKCQFIVVPLWIFRKGFFFLPFSIEFFDSMYWLYIFLLWTFLIVVFFFCGIRFVYCINIFVVVTVIFFSLSHLWLFYSIIFLFLGKVYWLGFINRYYLLFRIKSFNYLFIIEKLIKFSVRRNFLHCNSAFGRRNK